jgi:hypothetical protein
LISTIPPQARAWRRSDKFARRIDKDGELFHRKGNPIDNSISQKLRFRQMELPMKAKNEGPKLPKHVNESLRKQIVDVGNQAVENNRRMSDSTRQLAGVHSGIPQTKHVTVAMQSVTGKLAGPFPKRWIDPEGIAWAVTLNASVQLGHGGTLQIDLDRRNLAACTSDVTVADAHFLATLAFIAA